MTSINSSGYFALRNGVLFRHEASGVLTDITTAAQVQSVGVQTAVTVDFDGDGDVDILQAQPGGGTATFQESFDTVNCNPCADGQDAPRNNWIKVVPKGVVYGDHLTNSVTNTSLVGTRITVLETGATVWVQGNPGSSFAPSVPMSLGLGSNTEATLAILYPNGNDTLIGPVSANQTIELGDQSVPYVDDATVSVTKSLAPGSVNFTFDWETIGSPDNVKITITQDPSTPGGSCSNYNVVLNLDSPDIVFSEVALGINRRACTLTWAAQPCNPGCKFRYTIECKRGSAKSWSSERIVNVKTCVTGI